MILIPAIDIINNEPVRLYQGDYSQKEVVGKNIIELANSFEKAGASRIHLVDLDGAKTGQLVNDKTIKQVANNTNIQVDIGGGIRNLRDVSEYLDNGLDYVILGTSAISDEDFLIEAIKKYGKRIVVGIDAKNELVYGQGWLEASQINYLDFAKHLEKLGVDSIIVTDISKDGTLSGPNFKMYQTLKEHVDMKIIASGGIKSLDDLLALKAIGIYGAISGKAIYHQSLDLESAIKECD